MRELEEKIAVWRDRMKRTLPGDDEIVRELEEHLRDAVEARCREGMILENAFAAAVKQIGEPEALAREFGRVESRRLPTTRSVLVTLGLVAAATAGMSGFLASAYQGDKISLLLLVHVVIVTAGYYALAGAGLLGAWALVASWGQPLRVVARRDVRSTLFGLTIASSVLVPAGMVLGMFWAVDNLGRAWDWDPKEIGAALVLASTWLLLLIQKWKRVAEPVQWLVAVTGGIGVVLLLGAWVIKVEVPALVCVASIAGQVALVMFARRERSR